MLGFTGAQEAINQKYVVNGREWEIVGVVCDLHQQSLKHAIEPIVFAPFVSMAGFFSIKMKAPEAEATIRQVKQKYEAYTPGNNFNYFFMD